MKTVLDISPMVDDEVLDDDGMFVNSTVSNLLFDDVTWCDDVGMTSLPTSDLFAKLIRELLQLLITLIISLIKAHLSSKNKTIFI